jgi:hypothetical protein
VKILAIGGVRPSGHRVREGEWHREVAVRDARRGDWLTHEIRDPHAEVLGLEREILRVDPVFDRPGA